jgi:biotin carboxylase
LESAPAIVTEATKVKLKLDRACSTYGAKQEILETTNSPILFASFKNSVINLKQRAQKLLRGRGYTDGQTNRMLNIDY